MSVIDPRLLQQARRSLTTLDLTPGADFDDVKSARMTLTKVFHPDRFQSDAELRGYAEEKLKSINAAYAWLEENRALLAELSQVPEPELEAPIATPAPTRVVDFASLAPNWQIWALVACFVLLALATSLRDGTPSASVAANHPTSPFADDADASLAANPHPDLRGLHPTERQSIESICHTDKVMNGPAAYNRCLSLQLAQLQNAPRRPDLSALHPGERQAIESACIADKVMNGPAAYNRCLSAQLASLMSGPPRPDLSALHPSERQSIESVCRTDKVMNGPVAYNECLSRHLHELSGTAVPRHEGSAL